jgi:hypothetical protein
MIAESLSEKMMSICQQISLNRDQIKEEFCKAYLASVIPKNQPVTPEWLIQNVELVEQWHNAEKTTVSWYFRMKEKPNEKPF